MFLGDKGQPGKFSTIRYNYDIIIDNERMTLQKLNKNLGFYNIVPMGKDVSVEIVYDTEGKLLTGAGLIIRKKTTKQRTYFSLVRLSAINELENREKKSFLGECETNDQPSDFPVQIADEINRIFNNLFTIDVVNIVKHCTPYIRTEIVGNKYKIISGTGYEAEMQFETLKVKDFRTGKKANVRNFTIEMELNPDYEKERQEILDTIEKYCKELSRLNRSRFEISQIAVKVPEPPTREEIQAKKQEMKKAKKMEKE